MFEKQLALLRKEYEYEKAEFRRIAETQGIDRRIRKGDCWWPVSVGRSYYNSLDRLVVEIARPDDDDSDHNFEYGRSVSFFDRDAAGQLRHLGFSAIVSYAEPHRMVVTLPSEEALSQLHGLHRPGVQLHFDETTYRLMFEALGRVEEARGNRLAALRDIFHTAAPATFSAPPAVPLSLPWLNTSQQEAVRDVLRARDVLIVHGPPGTGKTTTLAEAISEVLRREPQVLVCAQSNTAVDWISEMLTDRGIQVLRIGNPSRVTDKMLANTYERRFECHPDYPALWQLRRTIRQLYAMPRKGRPEAFHQKVARLRDKADEIELRIRHALFDGCRVVASTLAGAASPLLTGQHFHTLFIDEAAQALEAACWIAIQHAHRVVFAGDHCQLPPTVKSPEAQRGGLARTLMETVAESKPDVVRLLTVQYRMNETLMRFSSDWFYQGKLTAHPSVRHRSLIGELDHPLVWIDTATAALPPDDVAQDAAAIAEDRQGLSLVNRAEAALTLRCLAAYVARIGRHRLADERTDIGIISPYKAQVQLLRRLLKGHDFLRPLRKSITVNTVDAFQGQERDIIMVSLVRANSSGQIGFLADLRRMNVAITRARLKLIIVGNAQTLCRHAFYRELHSRCHVVDEPPQTFSTEE